MFQAVYSPLIIPYALTALFCGILSFWLFSRENKNAAIWRFAVLESLFAIVALSLSFTIAVTDRELQNIAVNLAVIAAAFIPAIFLSSIYCFIYGDKIKYRRIILISGYIASFAALVLHFSGFLNHRSGLFAYSGIIAVAIIETIINIAMAESGIFLEKLKAALLAYLIALSGSALYFFEPAGNEVSKSILFFSAIILFSIFQLYALKRNRVSEVNDIIKKIIAWIATTAIVFVFLYFNLALFRPLIIYDDFRSTGFAFSVLFFLAWLVFVLSFRKIDRFLRRQVFEQQDLLKRFRRELITLRNQSELFDRIEQIFFDCLGVESVDFYQITADPAPRLSTAVRVGARSAYSMSLPYSGFFNNISNEKKIIAIDDYNILNPRSPENAKLKEIMLKIKASLLILLKVRNEAVIAIALGNRKGRKAYARNSIKIIEELLASFTAAYSNARLYEESKKWSKQLEHSVRERTAELEKMNIEYSAERDELERLNKVARGRESRLNELKKKLQQSEFTSLDKLQKI
ncbi:hypothetical protein EPN15_04045 [Patescibacteria group bacterium]|nr:MAG: hypothetical protein EPN15_04045 [Patescibacteria group bacterium]